MGMGHDKRGVPQIRDTFGVSLSCKILRIIVIWDLYWGSLYLWQLPHVPSALGLNHRMLAACLCFLHRCLESWKLPVPSTKWREKGPKLQKCTRLRKVTAVGNLRVTPLHSRHALLRVAFPGINSLEKYPKTSSWICYLCGARVLLSGGCDMGLTCMPAVTQLQVHGPQHGAPTCQELPIPPFSKQKIPLCPPKQQDP